MEIIDASAVGQDIEGNQRVILFVKLRAGALLDDDLVRTIRARIRSGKISDIAVRDTIHGRAVKNTTALAHPEALKLYADLVQLHE